jgi:hypothetical protein
VQDLQATVRQHAAYIGTPGRAHQHHTVQGAGTILHQQETLSGGASVDAQERCRVAHLSNMPPSRLLSSYTLQNHRCELCRAQEGADGQECSIQFTAFTEIRT